MNFQIPVQTYLKSKPETLVNFPFNDVSEVYKVKHKMFAILSESKAEVKAEDGSEPYWLNLKCDPDEAIILRDIFPSIIPGYHMNKKHWNTIILDGSVPQGEIERMIDNSYMLVVSNMPQKDQASILLHL
jgi:predicted DNA-binding protein (MmcQ/YjbR family)